jgi:hypothetical protein
VATPSADQAPFASNWIGCSGDATTYNAVRSAPAVLRGSACRLGLGGDPWGCPVRLPVEPSLPVGANADRRHRIPKQEYGATNCTGYDAAPRGRGSLTVRFTDAAVVAWGAEPRATWGRAATILGAGHHHGPDASNRVPPGLASDRRPDRLDHGPARPRLGCA